ncbi:hypothetical protein [Verrucomicrobium sp. GAS474]|uniref:hypothetical protein n=1 Tax=Verrucomicrobium sp. GAS474 TaxID=1882831 RepID=UPI0012FF8EA0|nr:hypothetical protein [Verrucomicrobium sp. GAS474]
MLIPKSQLRRVIMEGVSREQSSQDSKGHYLAVDLTSYFGGDTIQTADRIVIEQLKYSTRHPTIPWTAARLCESSKGPSLIAGLARAYQGLCEKHSSEALNAKISLRLVSNQPISPEVLETLTRLQIHLRNGKTLQAFSRKADASAKDLLTRFKKATKFKGSLFTSFVTHLDLSHCGEESRELQRIKLIQEVGATGISSPGDAVSALTSLVRKQALPDTVGQLGLGLNEVLACLGVGSLDHLFPEPPVFSFPKALIESSDAKRLAEVVLASSSGRVLAHAGAGVGKTTTALSLCKHLPEGSCVVVYDCFGGGDCHFGSVRHLAKGCLPQITNEIAVKCGMPFQLLSSDDVARERHLKRLVEDVSRVFQQEGAWLVLVIDAADNAFEMARKEGSSFFLERLWGLSLPPHCALIVTSRTHRCAGLKPPAGTHELLLEGFDLQASSQNLRNRYPLATDEQCQTFHTKTGGNPRVQFYYLTSKPAAPTIVDALRRRPESTLPVLLERVRRTSEDLFSDLYNDFSSHFASDVQEKTSLLIALSRPAPLEILSKAWRLSMQETKAACQALSPGIHIENDSLCFRDEDFDVWLNGKVTEESLAIAHGILAECLLERLETDVFSAVSIADHLYQANRHRDLIDLAVQRPISLCIQDVIKRLSVARRRLKLALQSAGHLDDAENALRLLLLSTDFIRSDASLKAAIAEHPELASRYGDPDVVAELFRQLKDGPLYGPACWRLAAVQAREENRREEAVTLFDQGKAWLNVRSVMIQETKMSSERSLWNITTDDIAFELEAVYFLYGEKAVVQRLKRWKPIRIWPELTQKLACRLAKSELPSRLCGHLEVLDLPAWARIIVLAEIWDQGGIPEKTLVQRTLRDLQQTPIGKRRREHLAKNIVSFGELALYSGETPELILWLFERFPQPFPKASPVSHIHRSDWDLPLRVHCLQSVIRGSDITLKSITPPVTEREERGWESYHLEEFSSTLEAYARRAAVIHTLSSVEKILPELRKDLQKRRGHAKQRWFKTDTTFFEWIKLSTQALLFCQGDASSFFDEISDASEALVQAGASHANLLLAEQLRVSSAYGLVTERLIEKAVEVISRTPAPAAERRSNLLRCAAATLKPETGEAYYRRALASTSSLDDDSIPILKLTSVIGQILAKAILPSEATQSAVRLVDILEQQVPFVSDSSSLPKREFIRTISLLDFPLGLATAARWDDEGLHWIGDGIFGLVDAAIDLDLLEWDGILALLNFALPHDSQYRVYLRLLDRLYEQGSGKRSELIRLIERISLSIRRDIPLSERKMHADAIITWAKEHHLAEQREIIELEKFAAFLSSLESNQGGGYSSVSLKTEAKSFPIVQEAMANDFSGLSDALSAAWRSRHKDGVDHLIQEIARELLANQRPAFLEALVQDPDNIVIHREIAKSFMSLLRQWRHTPEVEAWAPQGVFRFIASHLPALTRYEAEWSTSIQDVEEILAADVCQGRETQLLISAAAQNSDSLSVVEVINVAHVLAKRLNSTAILAVFQWWMTRLEGKLAQEKAKPLAKPPLAPPAHLNEALALFLWSFLGHSEKKIRWQALHSARSLIRAKQGSDLLGALVEKLPSKEAGAFRSPRLEFFWMSARMWLLLFLRHIAEDDMRRVASHGTKIVKVALDPEFPHVFVRQVAKEILEKLASEGFWNGSSEELERVSGLHEPKSCLLRPEWQALSEREESAKKGRFSFSEMDTVPYWFSPAGRVFGKWPEEFCRLAEKWICDRWGYSDKDWWSDPRELSSDSDWMKRSNDHGQEPEIETTRVYLEYHALMCVMGELIDREPLLIESYERESIVNPFQSWVNLEIGSPQTHFQWVSDFRSPTPLKPEYWRQFPEMERWFSPTDEEFEELAGVRKGMPREWITLSGYAGIADHRRQGNNDVRAVMIPEDQIAILGAALISKRRPRPLSLAELLNGYSREEQRRLGVTFLPWAEEVDGDAEWQHTDPRRKGINLGFSVFNKAMCQLLGLTPNSLRTSFTLANGSEAARMIVWGEKKENDSDSSAGRHFEVRADLIGHLLKKKRHALFIEATISRNYNSAYRSTKEDRPYDLGTSKYYIVRSNGSVESLERS